MKRLIIISLIALVAAATATAQPEAKSPREDNMEIADFVSDLSKNQQSKIDLITKRSTKIIGNYRQQLHDVRDSIRTYMNRPDDNSVVLFPLYEREGHLQSEISKEYYRCKLSIDKVLTPEQQRTLKEKMDKTRQNRELRQHNKSDKNKSPQKAPSKK